MTDSIRLVSKSCGSKGSIHAQFLINGHDSGMLYLTDDEYKLLTKVLTAGGENSNVTVDLSPLVEDEVDYDIFDTDLD